MSRLLGALSVYSAALLWSTIGVAATVAYRAGASPFETSFLRSFFTIPLAVLYLVARGRARLLAHTGLVSTSYAIVAPFYVSYLVAVEAIGVGLAAVLLYTAPLWVYAYTVARGRESIDFPGVVAVVMAFCGVMLLSAWAYTFSFTGLLAGLASGILYASLILRVEAMLERYRGVIGELEASLVMQAHAAPLLGLTVVFGSGSWASLLNPLVLASGVYLAVATGVGAYYLFYWGLSRIGSVYASVAATVEPLAALVWGIILFGEEASARKIVGALLIICSQVVLALRSLGSRQASS